LDCPTSTGLANLITGAGFNLIALDTADKLNLSDLPVRNYMAMPAIGFVQELDLGHVRCDAGSSGANLYAVDYGPGDRRYFADLRESADDRTPVRDILRNVGCGELLHAMGLDPISATVLPKSFVDTHFYTGTNYDINCASGQKPSDY